ncbi:MAG: glucosamine-6-phosphate deaminase [Limnochordia bacterium]|nr:glucosamine-6-phosphate deaminase [Limnochordia bacterium]MDD2629435.1 glucosamine-6-phosphate deaminase [Limnochordia bacterium]MDD4518371.1 glucosamine-6-phosphate deaminase [Limnochordia bacterium]
MRIIITDNYDQLSKQAAQLISNSIHENPKLVLGLATGSTPLGTYKSLIDLYQKQQVSFKQVRTFNLDEYLGLGPNHPSSYHHYMYNNLFDQIDINPENVRIPRGLAEDLDRECADYEKEIEGVGGIDLQILGIGVNGHIGFNEPQTPFGSRTRVVDLAQQTIEANARFFDNKADVPRQAISMGIRSIMHARRIVLLANGASKAWAIERSLQGPVTEDVPASVLQLHPDVTVILDREAAASLTL